MEFDGKTKSMEFIDEKNSTDDALPYNAIIGNSFNYKLKIILKALTTSSD